MVLHTLVDHSIWLCGWQGHCRQNSAAVLKFENYYFQVCSKQGEPISALDPKPLLSTSACDAASKSLEPDAGVSLNQGLLSGVPQT